MNEQWGKTNDEIHKHFACGSLLLGWLPTRRSHSAGRAPYIERDTPEIGSLIAPRPVIWEAGLHDSLMVAGWLEKASERMQRAYAAAGKPENFLVHRFDGGHAWNGEKAIPLLAKELKD